MSDALCECHLPPICSCCQREVEHLKAGWCFECFSQWYDPDNHEVDPTSRRSIANYVRKKAGLPPLAE